MTKLANNNIAYGTPRFRAALRKLSRLGPAAERRDFPLLLAFQIAASSSSPSNTVSAASYLLARGAAAPVSSPAQTSHGIVVLNDND